MKFMIFAISSFVLFPHGIESELVAQNDKGSSRSLQKAIDEFNSRVSMDSVGKSQPKLTKDEVVAFIYSQLESDWSKSALDKFLKIADTGRLPAGAEFKAISSWGGYRGRKFKVWWVDLRLPKVNKGLRIRNRFISSKPMEKK